MRKKTENWDRDGNAVTVVRNEDENHENVLTIHINYHLDILLERVIRRCFRRIRDGFVRMVRGRRGDG